MTDLTLRPLSLGEILDRAFSLYRNHFLLFVGIAAVPQVFSFAFVVLQPTRTITPGGTFDSSLLPQLMTQMAISLVYLVVLAFVLLFSAGGTTMAVSELYLGRRASISQALGRVWSDIGRLFGVVTLYWLVIIGGMMLLIIPGIYWICRLLICYPVAIIERTGPRASLKRSFFLTQGYAGRAFGILALSVCLTLAAQLLFGLPFRIPLAAAANDPGALRFWLILSQLGGAIAGALVAPVALIANAIFYYDLRVRKEAFDLQFMMNPDVAGELPRPSDASGLASGAA